MPKLTIFLETGRATHELTEERITIGRGPENLLQINDSSVSSRHAQLRLIDGHYQVKDLGSTNGTRVNGEVITDAFLRVGDRVRFGKVEARFDSVATGEAQPLPAVGEIEARPAATSEKPADFDNASPFPKRQNEKDPGALGILATAVVAILAFLLSMAGLLQIHGPR